MITKYHNIYKYLKEHRTSDYYIIYEYSCYYICANTYFPLDKLCIIQVTANHDNHLKNDISISKKDVDFIMNCQDEYIIKLFILKLINERL
jgi:hypothetical protein